MEILKLYLIGSLRNPELPILGNRIRALGLDVVDDWFGAGKEADDQWMLYEKTRGRHYGEALYGRAARHIFAFDKHHIDTADIGVLMMPAGRSGHLELGYLVGQGKLGFVLFPEEPERFDCMYQFAQEVFFDQDSLLDALKRCIDVGSIEGSRRQRSSRYTRRDHRPNYFRYS